MKIIIISSPKSIEHETSIVTKLFEEGLKHFHLRKPKYSTGKLSEYISEIPKQYWNRITVHSHHELSIKHNLKGIHVTRTHRKKTIRMFIKLKLLKFRRPDLKVSTSVHHLSFLYKKSYRFKFDYVLISPVFGSISKRGYEAGFSESQLKSALIKVDYETIALGGVSIDNVEKVSKLGFSGLALLGAIWNKDDPVEQFIRIKQKLSRIELNVKKIVKKEL